MKKDGTCFLLSRKEVLHKVQDQTCWMMAEYGYAHSMDMTVETCSSDSMSPEMTVTGVKRIKWLKKKLKSEEQKKSEKRVEKHNRAAWYGIIHGMARYDGVSRSKGRIWLSDGLSEGYG